jgi:hypothetical protein
VFESLQSLALARAISESTPLTSVLSAVHLIGFTLVMGAALVSNLRLLGCLFADRPAIDVLRPTGFGLRTGLAVSALTGALLFLPRAEAASQNGTFRLKMSLLVTAVLVHLAQRRLAAAGGARRSLERISGMTGLALWLGVGLAGCAYILLE